MAGMPALAPATIASTLSIHASSAARLHPQCRGLHTRQVGNLQGQYPPVIVPGHPDSRDEGRHRSARRLHPYMRRDLQPQATGHGSIRRRRHPRQALLRTRATGLGNVQLPTP